MITFGAVTKRYPDGTVAVDNLNLDVPRGTLALVHTARTRAAAMSRAAVIMPTTTGALIVWPQSMGRARSA